uniref:Uncharacterized protein n=1 Tax=Arundo donax TaxID=35708 RepID=A0A0A9C930_ARUDO
MLLHEIECLQGLFRQTSITILADHDIPRIHGGGTSSP